MQNSHGECILFGDEQLQVTASLLGGELQSLKTADGCEWLWQGDGAYWSDRAPNLFPYVGRLWDGRYEYAGHTYPMTIHGFISQQLLQVENQTATGVTFTFVDTAETRSVYPFSFRYTVEYQVINGRLAVEYRVENRSADTMYFGIGAHPGFRVPLEEGLTFENYRLGFESGITPLRLGFSDLCFRNRQDEPFALESDGAIPASHTLFDKDAIVLSHCGHSVCLFAPKGHRSVQVSFPAMSYLGIWHRPHTDAPYVCLEPWASLPAFHGETVHLETQADLIALAPGETYRNPWSISLINNGSIND